MPRSSGTVTSPLPHSEFQSCPSETNSQDPARLLGNHTDKRIRKSFLLAPIEPHGITMHVNSLRAFLRMGSNFRLQPTKT